MVDYRRMGNMGQEHLGNATRSFMHQLKDLWKSPRGTVIRIEALALVAIALSFFLAAFGSCRRCSNSWIIQKGFLAANAVFLSLGTYSIGLMQSSPVKSEMYPIWAVSLLALLCCVDSAAASGLDNQSQLWKMLYQLCLYFGYVLLMSISTISSDIGNIAICVLSATTFIKGFHMSMALVLPRSMWNMIREIPYTMGKCSFRGPDEVREFLVDSSLDIMTGDSHPIFMHDIASLSCEDTKLESHLHACKDVCLSFALSHLLQRCFLGLRSIEPEKTRNRPLVPNFERAFKVVETELAFLYDVLYSSNTFLYYYEAKNASIWAFASVVGIFFVGAVAVIPGARTTRHASPGTTVVHATIADLVITGLILVSLALLQLLLCWTSNWARVAFACDCVRDIRKKRGTDNYIVKEDVSWGMRMRGSLVSKISWSDKYLWQNKLGQHSLIESISVPSHYHQLFCGFMESIHHFIYSCAMMRKILGFLVSVTMKCWRLLGLQYIARVLQEMLQSSETEDAIELLPEEKKSIGNFVSEIKYTQVDHWASPKVENGGWWSLLPEYYPYSSFSPDDDEIYVSCILMWHITMCYCELAQQRDDKGFSLFSDEDVRESVKKNHGVAIALSKYCTYLVVSVPRLLPGRADTIKRMYDEVSKAAATGIGKMLGVEELLTMENFDESDEEGTAGSSVYVAGLKLGKGLRSAPAADRWRVMAGFWVKALVFAAPSDEVEEHMERLSQGGELVTHLWALLYHAGIHKWQLHSSGRYINMGWDYVFRNRSWQALNWDSHW